jgi:hypothetical protein
VHVSRFGLVLKKTPGAWRLIVDFSSPEGFSVNDGIEDHLGTPQYMSVENALDIARQLGRGCLLAKMDIKKAYRMIPVHPDDRPLLGMQWQDQLYLDATLPFGLRSAPKIFTAVADAAEWIARSAGIQWVGHYLDDFLLAGRPNSTECQLALEQLSDLFQQLGVPVAQDKTEGPSPVLTSWGSRSTLWLWKSVSPGKNSRAFKPYWVSGWRNALAAAGSWNPCWDHWGMHVVW